jgi:hypothetical protein
MSAAVLKGYQREAVEHALDVFRHAESLLQDAPDAASRRTVIAHHACLLLEAPTGAGKTLMAGAIAEGFSRADHPRNARVVWFWFTPFANLVEQTRGALKRDFSGLRLRDLSSDRIAHACASGDVFIATWSAVAAKNAETRKLRQTGDLSLSLDAFIPLLREGGLRIGAVIDEAHHTLFAKAPTQALRFYREVLQPEFTLLITATPDDADVKKFRKEVGIQYLSRNLVARHEAVDAGLIKQGIRSIAYLAAADQKTVVDLPATALAEGWQTHRAIKQQLSELGVRLTPLMLVQVGNSGKAGTNAIEEAKAKLLRLGVPEEAIAWYTADDPNDDLQAAAVDERKEVLLFKVAVALGFDAPRAFTLVSLRGAKDVGFGLQVVGRILRVHRQLQAYALAGTLPEALRFGYAFLADAESQTGLLSAAEKINAIKTELADVCPYTALVRVADTPEVQVIRNGQLSLLPQPLDPPAWHELDAPDPESPLVSMSAWTQTALPGLGQTDRMTHAIADDPNGQSARPAVPAFPGDVAHSLRTGMPSGFMTEQLPLSTDALLDCVGALLDLSAEVLSAGLRRSVKVTRRTIEIFAADDERIDQIQGRLSDDELARRGQRVLLDAQEALDPRDVREALMKRLRREYNEHQGLDLAETDIERAFHLILAAYPKLLTQALRACAARHKEAVEAQPLPLQIMTPPATPRSRLNLYGVLPLDLNTYERAFVDVLDADTSGTVRWWHRNPPRKPWSAGLVMSSGHRFFPDFILGVSNRTGGERIRLVETKGGHILDSEETLEKLQVEHQIYGPPIMLKRKDDGHFWVIRYSQQRDKAEEERIFRLEYLDQY